MPAGNRSPALLPFLRALAERLGGHLPDSFKRPLQALRGPVEDPPGTRLFLPGLQGVRRIGSVAAPLANLPDVFRVRQGARPPSAWPSGLMRLGLLGPWPVPPSPHIDYGGETELRGSSFRKGGAPAPPP